MKKNQRQRDHEELMRRIGETFRKGVEWIQSTKGNLRDPKKLTVDLDEAIALLRRDALRVEEFLRKN